MYKVFFDNTLVCDSRIEELALINPVVKLEELKAGSFSFKIPPGHPYYDTIRKRKTIVEVYLDDEKEPVFSGMCTKEEKDLYNQKTINCEGDMSFLNDSIQRPRRYQGYTVRGLLEAYIANHNAQVEESKRFVVGAVTVTDSNDYISCYTNMENTMKAIKEDLVDDLGGIIRIRHENGVRYIDYLADSPNTNSQVIKLGKNLVDFKSNIDSVDIATAVIPLGEKLEESTVDGLETRLTIADINGGSDYVYSQEAVDAYGWIYKTLTYDNVTTPEYLKQKGEQYLSEIQYENVVIEAKAVDLNLTDKSQERFKISDQIRVVSAPHGLNKYFRLTKQTLNLNNPEKDKVTLGKAEKQTLSAKSNQVGEEIKKAMESIVPQKHILTQAIENATALIATAMGGFVVKTNNELLIMDTDTIETATKVWRWNINGLGYSSNGYKGPYELAMTMDGSIVADLIRTGTLNAERIGAGKLEIVGESGDVLFSADYDKKTVYIRGENVYIGSQTVTEANKTLDNKIEDSIAEEEARAKGAEENLSSSIRINTQSIASEVARAKNAEESLSSKITQSADELRAEVTQRTSMYNEEVNTLQGGMDGNIDLSFFVTDEGTVITEQADKQCIYSPTMICQDMSIPSSTYVFSYEWLRSLSLYINASVALLDLTTNTEIYFKDVGYAWPGTEEWHEERFQFTLDKTTRVRFISQFSAPSGYEDRINSLYLTNIALFGTAQSVSDAITDMKSELMLQSDQIKAEVTRAREEEEALASRITLNADAITAEVSRAKDAEEGLSARIEVTADAITSKVEKGEVISTINQTAEEVTIQAEKIDLQGVVNAQEFTSKFATLENLNATNVTVANKLDANQFTAQNISAMGVTAGSVAAENITGTTISGKSFVGGEVRSTNYAASSSSYTSGGGMRIDLSAGNIWWANGSIKASTGFMNSIGYEVPTRNGGYNLNFKSALGVHSSNVNTMVLGGGYSTVMLPSGSAVTSVVEKKTNIIPCANALSAVENTDVYYFNYKNDSVKRDGSQKVGFIIGDGYNLDARLLSEDGDAIDTYNAIALNWRATQQLYDKIKKQQEQIKELMTTIEQLKDKG